MIFDSTETSFMFLKLLLCLLQTRMIRFRVTNCICFRLIWKHIALLNCFLFFKMSLYIYVDRNLFCLSWNYPNASWCNSIISSLCFSLFFFILVFFVLNILFVFFYSLSYLKAFLFKFNLKLYVCIYMHITYSQYIKLFNQIHSCPKLKLQLVL